MPQGSWCCIGVLKEARITKEAGGFLAKQAGLKEH